MAKVSILREVVEMMKPVKQYYKIENPYMKRLYKVIKLRKQITSNIFHKKIKRQLWKMM